MSSTYAGDPNNYPTEITIPSDGDGPGIKAEDVAVPLEALADRTAHTANAVAPLATATTSFTAAGPTDWTAPANVNFVAIWGCGGGSGGGGGAKPNIGNNEAACGGGGGAGAPYQFMIVPVTPNLVYEIFVGAGGSGGAGATVAGPGVNGGAGGNTVFREKVSTTVIATFPGVTQGGRGGVEHGNTGYYHAVPGAAPSAVLRPEQGAVDANNPEPIVNFQYGASYGGDGIDRYGEISGSGRGGAQSPQGYSGGLAGTVGTDSGSTLAGGAGGGGGAGPFGAGGASGNGANAGGAGAGSNGTAGSAASANTGAGGGGGGGGGGSSTATGNGAAGAAGGSGRFFLKAVG